MSTGRRHGSAAGALDDRAPEAEIIAYGIAPQGYRLPSDTRLGRVTLQVGDLDRSIEYYERVVGLRVLRRAPAGAALAPHGEDRVLVELRELRGARPKPARGRLGLYHFAILLPDRPALGRFVRHLSEQGISAAMSDHIVSEAIYLSDPDGLGIEVYADRPRGTWQHSDRQLHMATDPLDVDAVIRAAGDARWSGMPPGTRMGHVHLFVADLARAAAFYHDGLGFDKTVWSYPGALFMSAGGYHHHLGTNSWAARAARTEPEDAQLLAWELVLPTDADTEAAATSLRGRGFEPVREPDEWIVADPWGTVLRLTSTR